LIVKGSYLKNICFSLILIVLLFSTLELLCRYLLDSKEPARETGFEYTVDPDTLWHMVPTQTDAQPHVEFEYVINSHGLRCPDFPLKKPGGEKRILTIGDSVTMGHGVAEGEAYPQLLQKYLDERLPRCLTQGDQWRCERLLDERGINVPPEKRNDI